MQKKSNECSVRNVAVRSLLTVRFPRGGMLSVAAFLRASHLQRGSSNTRHDCTAVLERSEKDVQGKPTHTSGKSADLIEMRRQIRRQDFLNVFIAHVVSLGSKATLDHSRVKL